MLLYSGSTPTRDIKITATAAYAASRDLKVTTTVAYVAFCDCVRNSSRCPILRAWPGSLSALLETHQQEFKVFIHLDILACLIFVICFLLAGSSRAQHLGLPLIQTVLNSKRPHECVLALVTAAGLRDGGL